MIISEHNRKQSNQLKALNQVLHGIGIDKWSAKPLKRISFLPGRLYSCLYDGELRLILCVTNFRSGSNGIFLSQKSNTLGSLFQLENLKPSLVRAVLSVLYKGPSIANYYHVIRTLKQFKIRDYRSFDVKKVNDLVELEFDPNLLKRK